MFYYRYRSIILIIKVAASTDVTLYSITMLLIISVPRLGGVGLKVVAQDMLYSIFIKTPTRIKSLMLPLPFTALTPGITRNNDDRMSPRIDTCLLSTRVPSSFADLAALTFIYFIHSSSELQIIAL